MSIIILVHDRMLIKPIEVPEMVGGIIMPDSIKEKPNKGTVIQTGKGLPGEDMVILPGDIVTYPKSVGLPAEVNGEKYFIIEEGDVLLAERSEDANSK